MKIYIVRHGLAGERGDPRYPDDRLRPLTSEGRKRFSATARHLANVGFEPTIVGTSPLIRCRQTAEIIIEQAPGKPKLIELSALEPGSQLDELIEWTNQQRASAVAWVGHSPDVNELAAALIGGGDSSMRFAKGALACIAFDGEVERGAGELQWLVTAKVLGL